MPGGKPSHEQADPKGDPITRGSSYTKSEAPQRSQPHQHIPGATPIPGLGPGTTKLQKAAHLKSDPRRSQSHQHIPGATRSEPSPGPIPSRKPAHYQGRQMKCSLDLTQQLQLVAQNPVSPKSKRWGSLYNRFYTRYAPNFASFCCNPLPLSCSAAPDR